MNTKSSSAYEALKEKAAKLSALQGATEILHWDAAAIMPTGGAEARAAQLAELKVLIHQQQTDPALAEELERAESEADTLGEWARANIREMRRAYLHATAVPEPLVKALSEAGSRCEMRWRSARAENDFEGLRPYLEEVISLVRERATVKAEAMGVTPYEALLDEYEPEGSVEEIDRFFGELSEALPPLVEAALERQQAQGLAPLPSGPFSVDAQRQLGLKLMRAMGFDFAQGRLDVSHHPFCGGGPTDVRITTRYREDEFCSAMMGVIHETGHALYEQGRPRDLLSQPVSMARGMSLHESQSLLMEMQAGRSDAFISYLTPLVNEAFSLEPALDSKTLQSIYRRVERGLIRVDADELTYPSHVILRYELERALLDGRLEVRDLPGAWGEGMQRLVGVTPPDDRD
ncbi:MAG: carboxypeptidase M32, partial [Myxococcota bacterium]|nr:carboxypeptidase M32 [Myxococcota bacterium]